MSRVYSIFGNAVMQIHSSKPNAVNRAMAKKNQPPSGPLVVTGNVGSRPTRSLSVLRGEGLLPPPYLADDSPYIFQTPGDSPKCGELRGKMCFIWVRGVRAADRPPF